MNPQVFAEHGECNQPYPSTLPTKPSTITVFALWKSMSDMLSLHQTIQWSHCDNLFLIALPDQKIQLPGPPHPKIHIVQAPSKDIISFIGILLKEPIVNQKSRFYYFSINNIIPPSVWSSCISAPSSITFCKPEPGKQYLFNTNAAEPFSEAYLVSADTTSLLNQLNQTIQEMSINTTGTFTDLCHLAAIYGTDKSTYNLFTHRHPYTAVYSIFFNSFKSAAKPLRIAEIGVLNGSSIRMWKDYFGSDTIIHAFDISQSALETVKGIEGVKTHLLDSGNPDALNRIFNQICEEEGTFDIIIEDASHRLEHQVVCLRECTKFLKPGGILVIEDIFRAIPTSIFQESINVLSKTIAVEAYMITPEDVLRASPGWENDRLLIVRRTNRY